MMSIKLIKHIFHSQAVKIKLFATILLLTATITGAFLLFQKATLAQTVLMGSCDLNIYSNESDVWAIRGAIIVGSKDCTVPAGATTANVDVWSIDDGGNIYINGVLKLSIDWTVCGIKSGTIPSFSVTPGSNINIKIEAINCGLAGVGGDARINFYGPTPTPTPPPTPTPTPIPPTPTPTPIPPTPTPTPTPIPPTPTPTPTPIPPRPMRPVISNIRAINITNNGATVAWNTDVPADTQVEVCATYLRCGNYTPLNSALTTSHSVNLGSLSPDTYYYFWVMSKNANGLTVMGYSTFVTLGGTAPPTPVLPTPSVTPSVCASDVFQCPDGSYVGRVLPACNFAPCLSGPPTPTPTPIPTNPPIISNVQVTNITRDSATVTWETDRPADSQGGLCQYLIFCNIKTTDTAMTTYHLTVFSGLRADRKYRFKVGGADSDGNTGFSSILTFRTSPGLVMSDLQAVNITSSGATIVWGTNYSADSKVYVCTLFIYCYFATPAAVDPALVDSHSINIQGLRSDRNYYYTAVSVDAAGYQVSQRKKFRTSQ